MKVFGKDVSEYSDGQLTDMARSLKDAFDKREEAGSHQKFKKMAFPAPNQAFLDLTKTINDEIHKRQLDKW